MRYLQRRGRLPRAEQAEHDEPAPDEPVPDEPLLALLCAASVQGRVALGPTSGQPLTRRGRQRDRRPLLLPGELCCDLEGFSLAFAKAESIAWKKGWAAWIVTNPPCGERVGDERGADTTLKSLGDRLRVMAQGYRFGFLLGEKSLDRSLGLTIARRESWLNGGVDCGFVTGGV